EADLSLVLVERLKPEVSMHQRMSDEAWRPPSVLERVSLVDHPAEVEVDVGGIAHHDSSLRPRRALASLLRIEQPGSLGEAEPGRGLERRDPNEASRRLRLAASD